MNHVLLLLLPTTNNYRTPKHSPSSSRRASEVSRSGSVPNLHGEVQSPNRNCFLSKGGIVTASGIGFRPSQQNQYYQKQQQPSHHHHHYHSHHRNNTSGHHRRTSSRHSSLTKRSTREQQTDRFLHPGMLKYHRHAVSVDESHPPPSCLRPILSNSRQNVLLGSHPTMNSSSTSPTHHDSVIRMMRRSDTAKQHILARQRNIEESGNNKAALHSQFSSGSGGGGRRSVIRTNSFVESSFDAKFFACDTNPLTGAVPLPPTHQWACSSSSNT